MSSSGSHFLAQIQRDEKNANKGNARGRKLLAESLTKYGAGRSILLDKNNRVIAGNSTVDSARKVKEIKNLKIVDVSGDTIVAVRRVDLDLKKDKKAKELAVADNRTGEINLEWDPEVLASLDIDLKNFWNDAELQKVLGDLAPKAEAPEPQLDKAAQLQKKWKTKLGQVWQAGKHRLMCGDSGNSKDVATLFAGEKAWLIQTDPPYGVGYGDESGPDSAKCFAPIANDGSDGPQLQAFLEGVFACALPYLRKGAAWYLWHAQMTQGFFAAAQVKVHRQIIWAKSHFILGHGDYHWQHELCFYGWREGEKHRWFGDRSESTLWQIDNPRVHKNHPTEKPIDIFVKPMRLNTEPGDICYEPFSGSGSQLCAAQSTDRICYAMELAPPYVAIALERLSEMDLSPKLAKS